jgi:antitoxin component YwqK of YwqJK toxin-antitoxin module
MSQPPADLNLAEIPFVSGAIQYRYARVLAADGSRWLRHGLFVEYSESGVVVSEGSYVMGKEQGLWRDFHPNGQLAAEGMYDNGLEEGVWQFWNDRGELDRSATYENGVERAAA